MPKSKTRSKQRQAKIDARKSKVVPMPKPTPFSNVGNVVFTDEATGQKFKMDFHVNNLQVKLEPSFDPPLTGDEPATVIAQEWNQYVAFLRKRFGGK